MLQNARYALVSRALVTSISSRSSAFPTWNGEAERFTMSWAPARARSVAGGPGCQTSSQIVGPTLGLSEPEQHEVAALGEVAVLVEHAVVREELLAVDSAHPPVGAHGARVRQISVEPRRADECDETGRSRRDLVERLAGGTHEAGPEKQILRRVAGGGELREDDDVGSGTSRFGERIEDLRRGSRRGRRRPHSVVRARFS